MTMSTTNMMVNTDVGNKQDILIQLREQEDIRLVQEMSVLGKKNHVTESNVIIGENTLNSVRLKSIEREGTLTAMTKMRTIMSKCNKFVSCLVELTGQCTVFFFVGNLDFCKLTL